MSKTGKRRHTIADILRELLSYNGKLKLPMAVALLFAAAGAVLTFSIASAAVGVMLFWQPEVLCAIPGWFFAHPWALALLAASLAGAWFFVFWPERKKG